jgi:hypothetical protein
MRVPFQGGGLESLPYPEYYKLPPFSEGNPYTNTWTFPTDETTSPDSGTTSPDSGTTSPGINMGGGDGQTGLEQTWLSKKGDTKERTGIMKLLFPGSVQGTLGDRLANAPHIGLLGAIGWETSPLNPDSKHYNSNLRGELNFLEGITGTKLSGNWKYATKFDKYGKPIEFGTITDQMMIGRDPNSGHLRYGPGSVLAGKNVLSGFGSNSYEKALEEYIAKMEALGMRTHFQQKKLERAKKERDDFKLLHKKPIEDAIIGGGKGTDSRGRMTDTEYKTFMDDDEMLGDKPRYDPKKDYGEIVTPGYTPGYIRSGGADIDAGYWVGKKQHGHGPITVEDIKKDVTGMYTDDPSGLSGMDDAPSDNETSTGSSASTDNWSDYTFARGGLAQRAPRGSYFNGGLASLWRR